MRVLKISYKGRELSRTSLSRPSLILGRSPVCDIVLRSVGIRPVHFLFEYLGTEEFKPNYGEWSITDISGLSTRDTQVSSESVGQGCVLNEGSTSLGDFLFEWTEDKLYQTSIERGALRQQVKSLESWSPQPAGSLSVLEVIMVHAERDRVEDIIHIDLAGPLPTRIGDLPPVELDWNPSNAQVPVQVRLADPNSQIQFFQKGVPLPSSKEPGPRKANLGGSDLLQLHWQMRDYYFRLVPKLEKPKTPLEIQKDPFYRNSALATLVFLAIIWAVFKFVPEGSTEAPPPPRIARVEIKLPVESSPVEPKPEVAAPKLKDFQDKAEVKNSQAQPSGSEARSPVAPSNLSSRSSPKSRPATPSTKKASSLDLQNPAPTASVSQVGLLGSLKPAKSSNRVRADMVIDQGVVSQTLSGETGFLVKQAPTGSLGEKTRQNQKSLTEASSQVVRGDAAGSPSLGPIVDSSSTGGEFAIGYGMLTNLGEAREQIESVDGGLDKESVRRTLAQYRKEIKTCYDRALVKKPRISGRVLYQWTITGAGATISARELSSSLATPSLESCVQSVIEGIRWPESKNGSSTIVKYPFEFTSRK